MKIWRVDSNTYDVGCSELFVTQKAAEEEVARIKKGWSLAKTFITECEDIWGWISNNLTTYIENLISEYTQYTDESNWHYLTIKSVDLRNNIEDLFSESNIDDYSIIMEDISSTDEGQLYVLAISWYFEGELNHMMEFVVI